jgi:diguanylate cyclase (GGDEF)-like protein
VVERHEWSADALRRRLYLLALLVIVPLLPLIAVVRAEHEPYALTYYLALFVGTAAVLVGLATRRLSVHRAEVAVVVLMVSMNLVRLITATYVADATVTELRTVVVESIGPTLMASMLVIFLASGLRDARRWAAAVWAAFTLVLAPRVASVWSLDPQAGVAFVSQSVLLAIMAVLAYGLASLRTQLTEERVRARALDELANTDPLTGIGNRRGAQQALARHLALVARYGGELSVALFDLDRFKECNDHHGHAAGDEALVRIVTALRRELRTTDVLSRWGGDELLVVIPGVPALDAHHSADRWRAIVAELEVPAGPGRVTTSIGIATYRPGDTADSLLSRADQVMYVVKSRGGDAVATDEFEDPRAPAGALSS